MIRRPPRSTLFPYTTLFRSHPLEHRLIFKNIGREDWTTDIDCYVRDGGYEQLKQALTMSRSEIVEDRKSTRLNSSHGYISYAVFCLKKKKRKNVYYDSLERP